METGGVLVFGCTDTLATKGLGADERVIAAHHVEITGITTSVPLDEVGDALRSIDCKVVKIGALFSEESIKTVSDDFAPKPELLTVLRKEILPSLTILSATVPEVKALLDEAGVAVDYPKSVQDVLTMANALRSLGPEYVIIKREILEDDKRMSLLHYVLCGGTEPLTATSRVENSKGFFGASYSIPPAIAAQLAKGHSVPEAVSAGFKFVEEMLKEGQYFN
ncbi:hypothetical protein DL546_001321 [Coniochaeta pulveracea]|uniref:Pyridoxamine kinase/Phosphomethylpyrimidine kinase domain-containing protein n=1 Tax=Coniochaeta pulveracea TaxID=177199 RepID=A0A420YBI4_9PEZI|nr:hypothetical protein DL546_001321 [Coniochaeta pulveracea]